MSGCINKYAGFYYLLISWKNDDLKHLECEQTGALFISITLPSPSSRRWSEGVFVFCSGEFPQLLQLWLGDVRWISSWVILLRKLSSVTSDKHPSAAFNGVLIISSVTWLCQIIRGVMLVRWAATWICSFPLHISHTTATVALRQLWGDTQPDCALWWGGFCYEGQGLAVDGCQPSAMDDGIVPNPVPVFPTLRRDSDPGQHATSFVL